MNKDEFSVCVGANYINGQSTCGLKVGDTVKILRKAKDFEAGWPTTWLPEMDEIVNKVGLITEISSDGVSVKVDEYTEYYYPYFVLSPVDKGFPIHGDVVVNVYGDQRIIMYDPKDDTFNAVDSVGQIQSYISGQSDVLNTFYKIHSYTLLFNIFDTGTVNKE